VARIYTRTGDDGTTGLIGGSRISKDSPRIRAYGSVDELNALLGVVRSHDLPEHMDRILRRIQDELFILGANLALPEESAREQCGVPAVTQKDILELERDIDGSQASLEPLNQFILPGGSPAGALLHLARTVARRCERDVVALSRFEAVDPAVIQYLNRLSDLCFVVARVINQKASRWERNPSFGDRMNLGETAE
jgi:cob(I)alamin adenosyltransferase